LSEMPPIEPPRPPTGAVATSLPWEDPNAGIPSIFPTVVRFVASPLKAFESMSLTVDLVRPIAYFVLFVLLSVPVGQLWRYLLWTRETSGLDFIPKDVLAQAPWIGVMLDRPTIFIVLGLMVIAPLLNLIALFVWSFIVHTLLSMVGGAQNGFGATLRVMCYSQTASVAILIPVAGGLIQGVWSLVLQIMGLSQVHRSPGWKAAFAVIAPLVVCCGCVAGAVLMSGLAAGGLLKR
jgi:hypothetical protein